jgi:hypothetical protein
VEAAPLIPEVVVVGSKDPTKEEIKDESSSGVVLVAAAEADVVVAASEVVVAASEVVVGGSEVVAGGSEVVAGGPEVVVAAAEVVGTRTLDMSDTIELSKLLRPRLEALLVVDVVVLDAAVDPPVPENDTPDVTLESEVVVGAGGSVVLELVVKTPPGPKVIPPSVDAAAEDVVGTKALVSVVDDVGAITTKGSEPVDPIRGSLVVVVVGIGVGSIPTTVVCWITTVVVDIAAELELVGKDGNRLSNEFPVPAAEPDPDVSEFVPVIPFKKVPKSWRFVVDEKASCELSSVSFGVWVVIVEFWNMALLIDLGK